MPKTSFRKNSDSPILFPFLKVASKTDQFTMIVFGSLSTEEIGQID
ncbi:hypothetical protein [Bathymodiolus platifrons methanotrophic gill symbiont]|nr:hypothetical protein [Bathymodiolus platifrons methanotrophic gill symbiont]